MGAFSGEQPVPIIRSAQPAANHGRRRLPQLFMLTVPVRVPIGNRLQAHDILEYSAEIFRIAESHHFAYLPDGTVGVYQQFFRVVDADSQ